MYFYTVFGFFFLTTCIFVVEGRALQEDAVCRREHGVCTWDMYSNVRLLAQRSSGCRNFCQCAHSSTQFDGSVTYMWVKHECPLGTLFDDTLPAPVCNHAFLVQCEAAEDNGDANCEREHGVCSQSTYENIRLVALKSSGCSEFCQCEHASTEVDGSVTYRWAKQVCPAGTLFDESLPAPVCNHANQVQCNATGNSADDSSDNGGAGNGNVDNGSSDDECQREHGVCSQSTYENIRLVALKSSGCSEFCQCEHASTEVDGSVTYRWAKQVCPAGTLFDESLPAPVCNHANQVQCNGDNVDDNSDNGGDGNGNVDNSSSDDKCQREHGVCSKSTYENIRLVALKSSGCSEFCQCEHASTEVDGSVTYRWAKQVCPAGTLFDESLPAPVCNHANQVQCNVDVDNDNDNNVVPDNDSDNSGDNDNGNAVGDSNGDGNDDCQREHGVCSKSTYENIRLVALKSSGCAEFCQCEHASTEVDGSVTYRWAKQVCPAGTLFDESLPVPVCNHAYQVQCNANNDEDDCEKEHGVCSPSTYAYIRLVALKSSGCAEFCQCEYASTQWDGSVTYRWAKQVCPAGTLFDESLPAPVCNHANQVQCNVDVDNDNDNSGDNDNGNAVGDNNGDGDDDCQREHGVCSKSTYENIRLVALKSSGCAEFCQCEHASTEVDGSVTYRWAKQVCPAGTLFDESLPVPVCNHAYQVQCNANNDEDDCEKEHGVCSPSTYAYIRLVALKSSGCAEFCQCEYASTQWDGSVTYRWAKQVCPAGTLFDESLPAPVCNHAYQVQCDGNNDNDNGNDGDGDRDNDGNNTDNNTDEDGDNDGDNDDDDSDTKDNDNDSESDNDDSDNGSKSNDNNGSDDSESGSKSKSKSGSKSKEKSSSKSKGKNGSKSKSKSGSDDSESDSKGKDENDNDESVSKSKSKSKEKSSSKSKGKSVSKSKSKSGSDDSESGSKSKDNSSSDDNDSDNKTKGKSSSKSKGKNSSKSKDKSGSKSKDKSGSNDSDSKSKGKSSSKSSGKSSSKSKGKSSSKSKGKSGSSSTNSNDNDAEDELQEVPNPFFQCFNCHKEKTNSACNGGTEVCAHNKQSCQTIVEWRGDKYEVRKGCKNPTANTANAKLGCKKTGSKIFCRYECTENLCNEPLPAISLDD